MKESPISFNGDMVRAILDSRKTQTRCVIKDQPRITEKRLDELGVWNPDMSLSQHVNQAWQHGFIGVDCPFGQVNDRLWVREDYALSVIDPDGGPPEDDPENYDVIYRIDGSSMGWTDGKGNTIPAPWRHANTMPIWASRILLEITKIRIERLNDITDEDAFAEGIDDEVILSMGCTIDAARCAFSMLWESIYGLGGWEDNPWVWVIEFKRVEVQS